MDLGIKGRIALISGADSGMGKETARLMLEAGVRVALTDKPDGTLDEAVKELSPLGECIGVTGDVTKADDVERLWSEVRDRMGDPDIYVNAAGVTGATGDFLDVDDAGWLETLDINLMGAVRMCRQAIPAMRRSGYRRDLRRVEYGDERDPAQRAQLQAISPLTSVDKITIPLLVATGGNDPRVPASEADQIVSAVRSNGGTAWHLLAQNEGHGFHKKENEDYYFWTSLLFWKQTLLGDGAR